MATISQIKERLIKKSKDEWQAFFSKYPHTTELTDERHFEWDARLEGQDLAPQIEEWLADHAGEDFGIINRTIGFKDADTAFHFRVRWG